jgi:hypothetical protein
MGAAFDYRTYDTDDRREVQSRWLDDREEAEIEHINDCEDDGMDEDEIDEDMMYSGMINTLDEDIDWQNVEPFDNEELAADYVEKQHEKWEPPLGIPFENGDKINYLVGGWCSD